MNEKIKDENQNIRKEAMRIIGNSGNENLKKEATPLLIESLKDTDKEIREGATDILKRITGRDYPVIEEKDNKDR